MLNLLSDFMILDNPNYKDYSIVRDKIIKAKDYPTKISLYKSLSKNVSKSKFDKIILHLFETHKIIKTKDRKIMWIRADSPKLSKFVSESVLLNYFCKGGNYGITKEI